MLQFHNPPQQRVRLLILTLTVGLLFPFWNLMLVHYFVQPLDFLFTTSTCVPSDPSLQLDNLSQVDFIKTATNILLFLLFFIPHYCMATLKYKIFMKGKWAAFPLYERLCYNILSSLIILVAFSSMQPQNYVLFELPRIATLPWAIIGLVFFKLADSAFEKSIIFPFKIREIMSSEKLSVPSYETKQNEGITTQGIYGWIRHPMQSGMILLFTFGSPIFTLQKCISLLFLYSVVLMGVKMEESRLKIKFSQYPHYMQTVKARFIPFVV